MLQYIHRMETRKKEKIGAAIFGVFALLFLVLGIRKFDERLYGPRHSQKTPQQLSFDVQQQFDGTLDTDKDGLSDLEEKTVYQTSAYVADSDSDGVDDGLEIARGENPLCPIGQTCVKGSTAGNFGQENAVFSTLGSAQTNAQNSAQSLSTTKLKPEEIRKMLVDAGADAQALAKVPDDQLQKIYDETAGSEQFSEQQKIIQAFQGQNPKQLREILLGQGVSKEELNKISDEQLSELFKQALQKGS